MAGRASGAASSRSPHQSAAVSLSNGPTSQVPTPPPRSLCQQGGSLSRAVRVASRTVTLPPPPDPRYKPWSLRWTVTVVALGVAAGIAAYAGHVADSTGLGWVSMVLGFAALSAVFDGVTDR